MSRHDENYESDDVRCRRCHGLCAAGLCAESARADCRVASLQEERDALRQRAEQITAAFREYARHAEGCSAEHGAEYRCRCGLRDYLAALGEKE